MSLAFRTITKRFLGKFLCLLVSGSMCLTLVVTAQQQEKQQTKKPGDEDDIIKVNANLVNLDVTVKDKKGKAVTDLKAEDFTISENGARQTIEFFDSTLSAKNSDAQPASADSAASGSGVVTTTSRSGIPRNIVSLVLDGQSTESTNLKPVRDGIVKYIRERITSSDSVALFAIAGGLQLLQPFTQDKERLISAVEQAANISTGAKTSEQRDLNASIAALRDQLASAPTAAVDTAAGGSSAAQTMMTTRVLEQYVQLRSALSVQQSRPILASLAAICEGLRPIPGKKTLVMFSQGFVAPQVLDWQVQSTIDIANRSNVSIYIIDSTGLKGGTPQSGALVPTGALSSISAATSQESRIRAGAGESVFDISRQEGLDRQQDLLYRISGDTGGKFIKNTNDISSGLDRIDDEIRSRYTLSYRSTDSNFDGSFRKVKIEVRRPGVTLITRPGYYAIPPSQVVPLSPEDKKMIANFSSLESRSTLPLSLELNPFRSHQGLYTVPLSFEIAPGSVTFDHKDGKQRLALEVLGLVRRENEEQVLSRLGGNFDVALSPKEYESILNNNIFYRQDMELGSGSYTIDLMVKDRISGKFAARREKLVLPEVPDDSELAVTDAILSRFAEVSIPSLKGPSDVLSTGGVKIRPSPSRQFRAVDNLIVFFQLYGAATARDTGKAAVKVTISLMKDGKLVVKPLEYELVEVSNEPVPHLTFAKYIKLTGLAPGKYIAVIESSDTIRHKQVKREASFSIIP